MKIKQKPIDLKQRYYSTTPYKIIHWIDSEGTGAEGWVVIDKLINNVSGGGLFMDVNATLKEVMDLARSMSYKNSLQYPQFGGAKGGIKFDPHHKSAIHVLKRFLLAQKEILETIWCTGADLNTRNEEIFYITKKYLKLESPFVSLANMLNRTCNISPQYTILEESLNFQTSKYFTLGNSITGYILAHTLRIFSTELRHERKIILQGFGKVGRSLAYYLYKENIGKIVGIQEKDWGLYKEDGIKIDDILTLASTNKLEASLLDTPDFYIRDQNSTEEDFLIDFLSKTKANIFCPCAKRYTITQKVLDILINNTFASTNNTDNYIIGGANNIFYDMEVLENALDKEIKFLPEWVSNSGNSLLFMESLKEKVLPDNWDKIIQYKILTKIKEFLEQSKEFSSINNLSYYEACHEYSLRK